MDRKRLWSQTTLVQIPPGHLPAVAQPGKLLGPSAAVSGKKGGGGDDADSTRLGFLLLL